MTITEDYINRFQAHFTEKTNITYSSNELPYFLIQ